MSFLVTSLCLCLYFSLTLTLLLFTSLSLFISFCFLNPQVFLLAPLLSSLSASPYISLASFLCSSSVLFFLSPFFFLYVLSDFVFVFFNFLNSFVTLTCLFWFGSTSVLGPVSAG